MSLVAMVLEIHAHLAQEQVGHAFGGALALAYVGEPRGTVDIDVNVFMPADDLEEIISLFARLRLHPQDGAATGPPVAGVRMRREGDPFPVDVFASLGPAYAEIERRAVLRPFGPDRQGVPFLSMEDLVVFKLSFGRAKDWTDLQGIAAGHPAVDVDYVERMVLTLRGPTMHPRIARLRALLRAA